MIPAEHHIDTGQQLDGLKGLDDIVLRPQPQALDPIGDSGPGGDEDDGNFQGADVFHQLKAVNLGNHDVQQDEIEGSLFQKIGGGVPVIGADAVIPLLGQAEADHIGDGLFVLDDEDAYQNKLLLCDWDGLILTQNGIKTATIQVSSLIILLPADKDKARPRRGRVPVFV